MRWRLVIGFSSVSGGSVVLTPGGGGGTMPVEVEVLAHGAPAAGARVRVWSEESGLRLDGAADARGRLAFEYAAPTTAAMDHLYARASLAGNVDGADDVELFYEMPVPATRTLGLRAEQHHAAHGCQRARAAGSRL